MSVEVQSAELTASCIMASDRGMLLNHLKTVLPVRGITNSKEDAPDLFALFISAMRLANSGVARCPIHKRFPENYVGCLRDYAEIQLSLEDIIDRPPAFDANKVWRLLVYMWLGCGGAYSQPWERLRDSAAVASYRAKDRSQPLVVLKYIRSCFEKDTTLRLRDVIGGDGLDKLSRKKKQAYLVAWHEMVPDLVQQWHANQTLFLMLLQDLPSFGPLTRKEFFCFLAASEKYATLRHFGQGHMECGDGAEKGSKLFNVTLASTESLALKVHQYCGPYRASLTVTRADVEVSLCNAVVYIRHVRELQNKLPSQLTTFAGQRPMESGRYVERPELPSLTDSELQVKMIPPRYLSRALKFAKGMKVAARFLVAKSAQTRSPRGSKGTGARKSTAKGKRCWDAKHPNQCRKCGLFLGARCGMHCGQAVKEQVKTLPRRR